MIKVFRLFAMCTIGVVLATPSIAWAQTYTSVDYPGAIATYLNGGPNPQGTCVGGWEDASFVWHGFTYHDGTYTSFDPPGSTATFPAWPTPQGVIVGGYYDQSGVEHGFILQNGQFTDVDYPGAAATGLNGMSPSGEISGIYCVDSACNNFHSFIRSKKGRFTSFDPPGAAGGSTAATINPSGAIVGWYFSDSPRKGPYDHGYLLYKGKFATIDYPGATWTYAGANNPQGDITGGYADSSNVPHGYLLSHGVFTSFDYPGAIATYGTGINPEGIIVGGYYDSAGNNHGFIRKP